MVNAIDEIATIPARRQAEGAGTIVATERVQRLRDMETFFHTLPHRRAEAGLGPVPTNIRELAHEEREGTSP